MRFDKPRSYGFHHGMISRTAMDLWQGCVLALPFWDRQLRIVEDISGNNLHGLLSGGMDPVGDWKVSTYGSCLDFNGGAIQDLTTAAPPGTVLDGTSRMSWEIIFRCDAPTAGSGIIQALMGKYTTTVNQRAWRIYVDGDEIELQVSGDGAANEVQATTNANLGNGVWAHVVMTYDAGVFRAYKDGVALTTDGDFGTQLTIFAGVTEPFRIAARSDGNRLAGMIAGIRIWRDRILDLETVRRIYDDPWEMYEPVYPMPFMQTFALDHGSGGTAAGAWELAGTVSAGVQTFLVPGLVNGTSYDIQTKAVDASGNTSAGTTPVAGTPAGLVTTLRDVRLARKTRSRPSGALRARTVRR